MNKENVILEDNDLHLLGDSRNIEFIVDDNDEGLTSSSESIESEAKDAVEHSEEALSENEEENILTDNNKSAIKTYPSAVKRTNSSSINVNRRPKIKKPNITTPTILKSTSKTKVTSAESDEGNSNPCFVSNCNLKPEESVFLFNVPQNETLLELWEKFSGVNRKLTSNDLICQQHFHKDDVLKLEHGYEKNKVRLRKEALPCVNFYKECAVPICSNPSEKSYQFPVIDKDNWHLWIYMVKNPKLKNWNVVDKWRYRVCGRHFESNCFDENNELTNAAVPTLFLPELQIQNILNSLHASKVTSYAQKTGPERKCAFATCQQKDAKQKKMFPFPNDFQRCKDWLRACSRKDLIGVTLDETYLNIKREYLTVCEDHFTYSDYRDSELYLLVRSAVPKPIAEIERSAKSREDKDIEELLAVLESPDPVKIDDMSLPGSPEPAKWLEIKNPRILDEDKTKCILAADRLTFPGIGNYLYLGQKRTENSKFPYKVYKYNEGCYAEIENIGLGESLKIHTAIIIDDDDDCEREVLQQLLDSRNKVSK